MNLSQWFSTQLRGGAEGFAWAMQQVPSERLFTVPPSRFLGAWPAMRHVDHLRHYERALALPSMQMWLDGPGVSVEQAQAWERLDLAWQPGEALALEERLADFRAVREAQIALVEVVGQAAWETTRPTVWGEVSLKWVVSKTFQHTAEHLCTVMQIALFWDMS